MHIKDQLDALIEELRFHDINEEILNAMKKIKRHLFVLIKYKYEAYENRALPLNHGSTISQPYTVGLMLQELELKKGLKVLEVGTGSGWNAALIGYLVGSKGSVYSTEVLPKIAEFAKENIKKNGIKNVRIFVCNVLKEPLFKDVKFDRIVVTAGAEEFPEELLKMLKNNGILLCPVGKETQEMIKVRKKNGKIIKKNLGEFIFVPLER
ncbi:protein-L-isoaspartate O-methyltransferase [Candidatus Woesearchaeota archaeon]|nr:protein-L-isoaspartate O-methyltransferase [Candidatus Woesearchaeota archaeon]